ncbi:hypothetical protein JCM17823_11040 [Halorubrum gandharaense]
MSTPQTDSTTASNEGDTAPTDEDRVAALRTRVAVLEEENRQLRDEYARARTVTYRKTALGLGGLGIVGVLGALLFPDARDVLFALGGTGLFAAVLTYVLTPERFVAASVGARVFRTLARDRDAVVDELGLAGDPVYVPGEDVRLFVPRSTKGPIPDPKALGEFFVVPDDPQRGGVAFHPTGADLLAEFTETSSATIESKPTAVAAVLGEAVVELFELADGVEYAVDADTDRVTFEVDGIMLGDPTAIDHPVVSFLAVGLVSMLDEPVHVTVLDESPTVISCTVGQTHTDSG